GGDAAAARAENRRKSLLLLFRRSVRAARNPVARVVASDAITQEARASGSSRRRVPVRRKYGLRDNSFASVPQSSTKRSSRLFRRTSCCGTTRATKGRWISHIPRCAL